MTSFWVDLCCFPARKKVSLRTGKQHRVSKKLIYFASHLIFIIIFSRLTVKCCFSKTEEITPKMCRLCVCVLRNKRSFEPFMCLDLVVLER